MKVARAALKTVTASLSLGLIVFLASCSGGQPGPQTTAKVIRTATVSGGQPGPQTTAKVIRTATVIDLLIKSPVNNIDRKQQWQRIYDKYNAITVQMSGSLRTVMIDASGPYADIQDGGEWVTAHFNRKYESSMAPLKSGTLVVIQGVVSVKVPDNGYGSVQLLDCDLVQVLDTPTPTPTPTPGPTPKPTPTSMPTLTSTPTQTTPAPTPPAIVDATQMYVDYQLNAISADSKYKGRLVIVNGIFVKSGSSLFGGPYICLAAGPGSSYGTDTVQCSFDPKYSSDLANLQIGHKITVQGTCNGYLINILLDKCSLVYSPIPTPTPKPTPTPTPTPILTPTTPVQGPLSVKIIQASLPSGSNLNVDLSGTSDTMTWVQTMILTSDIDQQTYNAQVNISRNSGAGFFVHLSFQNATVHVRLLGSGGVLLFDKDVTIAT